MLASVRLDRLAECLARMGSNRIGDRGGEVGREPGVESRARLRRNDPVDEVRPDTMLRRNRLASADSSLRWAMKVILCLRASRRARFSVRIRLPAVGGYGSSEVTMTTFKHRDTQDDSITLDSTGPDLPLHFTVCTLQFSLFTLGSSGSENAWLRNFTVASLGGLWLGKR